MSTSTRQRALCYLSDHLQQQPHGPEFAVSGDELYTWLRASLTQAGHRQRPAYAYEANRLYCAVIDTYRQAGNDVAADHGQDFFDVAALYDAVQWATRHNAPTPRPPSTAATVVVMSGGYVVHLCLVGRC